MNGIQSMLPGVVGPLSSMGVEPLKQLFARAMSPGGASMGVPPLAILGAIEKASAAQKLRQAQAGGVAQMQAQQPTVRDEVLGQAYAGGGIVAFANGTGPDGLPQQSAEEDISDDPSLSLAERWRRSQKRAELSRQQGIGRSYAERFPAPQESTTDTGDEAGRLLRRGRPDLSMPPAINVPFGRGMAAERKPSGVASLVSSRQPAAPQASAQSSRPGLASLTSPVEATGTPAPDALSSIEAEARAQSEGLQKLLAAQGQVDPRIIAARKEAAELAQRTISEREKRAAGALEAAGAPMSQRLLDNQEALLRLAGSLGGAKRFGEGLSKMAGEAGAVRGEQRKAFEAAQRENRLEQDAIDKLRQAQADLQLSQATGDVTGERGAALKVEEAKANLINTRLGIQKERAVEADREEKNRIERAKMESQERIARENRAATAALRNLPTSEQQMAKQVMDDYIRKNPGATLSDAYDFYRGAGKPTDRAVLTYAQAAKIVDERLSSPTALMMLEKEEQKLAKQQGRAPRSTAQMRADLIRQEQEMAGQSAAAPTGAPAPAAGGTARPTSKAEFDALPKGARYINPADGKEYIKN